jgi:very-short-patch-repair endonuclease/predicted kinase
MPTLDDRLLPVLAHQHWLIAHDDVLRLGGTPDQITRRLDTGTWVRVDHGVYRPAQAPSSWHATVLAPILSARPSAQVVASDLTAAALHGIPGYGRGRPELSTPRQYNLRRDGMRIRTSTDLDRCGIVVLDGIPTTELARTILDLGRSVGDRRVLRAAEWARRERRLTWSDLIATLARHARRGRGGVRRLRRVILANSHRNEVTDSDFELLLLGLLLEHGLPEPVLHHRIDDAGRFVAEVDLAFPGFKIAIEADGPAHLDPDVRERDLARQNDLVLLGWTILRFTWERLTTRPDLVVGVVRAALARARARGRPAA